ncbi:MAG: hypothetical protein ABFD81_00690 [Syntrophaceae bacterium]
MVKELLGGRYIGNLIEIVPFGVPYVYQKKNLTEKKQPQTNQNGWAEKPYAFYAVSWMTNLQIPTHGMLRLSDYESNNPIMHAGLDESSSEYDYTWSILRWVTNEAARVPG